MLGTNYGQTDLCLEFGYRTDIAATRYTQFSKTMLASILVSGGINILVAGNRGSGAKNGCGNGLICEIFSNTLFIF